MMHSVLFTVVIYKKTCGTRGRLLGWIGGSIELDKPAVTTGDVRYDLSGVKLNQRKYKEEMFNCAIYRPILFHWR